LEQEEDKRRVLIEPLEEEDEEECFSVLEFKLFE
jgi:hypothetical protein